MSSQGADKVCMSPPLYSFEEILPIRVTEETPHRRKSG
jgi:hypothetical protein